MMRFGLAPNGSAREPSSPWLTTETKDQAPISPSLTEDVWARAVIGARTPRIRKATRLERCMAVAPPGRESLFRAMGARQRPLPAQLSCRTAEAVLRR